MKRCARKIVACLLLGFITTVAVTFAAAKWVDVECWRSELGAPTAEGYLPGPGPIWNLIIYRAPAALRISGFLELAAIVDSDELRLTGDVPQWTRLRERVGEPADSSCLIDARGWPFLAFWCEYTDTGRRSIDEYDIEGGIDIRFPKPPLSTASGLFGGLITPPAMPLRPIWGGLIGDTLFYAAAWYALITAPGAMRRILREHRGLCPACGYNLRGHAQSTRCPECGASYGNTPRTS